MSKTVKVWLIVAASLILVGGIIFTGAMAMSDWDIKNLSTSKYETNKYNITDTFNRIYISLHRLRMLIYCRLTTVLAGFSAMK